MIHTVSVAFIALAFITMVAAISAAAEETKNASSSSMLLNAAGAVLGRDKVIGVTLCACGTLVGALGNLLVQDSHHMNIKIQRAKRLSTNVHTIRGMERRSMYSLIIGNLFITVIGSTFTLVSFAFADQTVLAPLAGLTIVWNVLLMRLPLFGSRVLKRGEDIATWSILIGCAVILLFSPTSSDFVDQSTPNDNDVDKTMAIVDKLFTRRWLALCVVCGVGCSTIIMSGSLTKNQSDFFRFLETHEMALWSTLPGILGGFSNGFAKAAIDLLTLWLDTDKDKKMKTNSEYSIEILILVVAVVSIILALLQLFYLNFALAKWQVANVVPIYQAVLIVAGVVCGSVLSGLAFSISSAILCSLGLIAVIGGVVQLSKGQVGLEYEAVDNKESDMT